MRVHQIYTHNAMRNFHYLVACEETGEALVIDPLESELVLDVAKSNDYNITQIVNTHEHWDHIGGNDALKNATGAKVLAHKDAINAISTIDDGLASDDVIHVGSQVKLKVLDTPGHTMTHVCLLSQGDNPVLFSGDTLFNAGCGNCRAGGHPVALYETFSQQLFHLEESTRVYPGHDYLVNNLAFSLAREPGNTAVQKLLANIGDYDPTKPIVTTIGLEKAINPFFRLENETIREQILAENIRLEDDSDKSVFLALRELRNHW